MANSNGIPGPHDASQIVVSGRGGMPRHFHLLWDEDLEEMKTIFDAVRERRSEVVSIWYQLYELHFGPSRTLSESEFFRIFEPAIFRNKTDLLEKNMDQYAEDVRNLGETLAQRGVPLQELIASLHLFEEAAQSVFPNDPTPTIETYTKFDKLSHIRIILLTDAYFRLLCASTGTRIRDLEREAARLPSSERQRFHGIVGAAPAMQLLYERIDAAAQTSGTVLIIGESGTGKELVARALHEAGPRHTAPFVALNCAALPKDLIESELFGHKRGSFSGANSEYPGLFRAAERGTLFLDEITEMAPETQAKLLRAVQERSIRPVGSTTEVPVNTRLIASTNREPREAVASHMLREDLYYRLQANVLNVPPMRERIDDVPLLIDHFMEFFNVRLGRITPIKGIEETALNAMRRYEWPGNVRELANAVESAMTFGRSELIQLSDLPAPLGGNSFTPKIAEQNARSASPTIGTFAEVERDLILRALEVSDWNKVHAAKLLKISRKKLYAKISKYELE